jgi:LysM repeat protein
MRRRSLLAVIILNVIVTFLVTFITLSVYNRVVPVPTQRYATVPPLIITATTDPNTTPKVVIITATPGAGVTQIADQPTSDGLSATQAPTGSGLQTLDPALLPTSAAAVDTAQSITLTPAGIATDANGCQTYALKAGDTAGSIASAFNVPLPDLMRANNLTDRDLTRLQIGQVLVIPLNGCGLTATESPTETPTKFIVPTPLATTTLAPTASQAKVEISRVINPGDITSEGIELHNISGAVLPMQGWTLSDSKGDTFTFPDYRMFNSGRVTIYTRSGTNTPIVLYWGQARAVWSSPDEVITLKDAKGEVQASLRVGDSGGASAVTPTVGS